MSPEGLSLSGGYLQPLSGDLSVEQLTAALNGVINTVNQQLQTNVQTDQTSKRFISGYQPGGWPGGDFGLKVSPPGVDVTTCPFENLLYAQDFTTGIQYYNVDGASLLTIGSDSSGNTGMELFNGSNAELFIGKDSSGNIVVKLAKPGFDARTATADQLILNSGQDNFKIALTDSTTITVPITAGAVTGTPISHGQITPPTILAFVTPPGGIGGTPTPWTAYNGSGNLLVIADFNYVENINFQFYVQSTSVSPSVEAGVWTFKYYVLQETSA